MKITLCCRALSITYNSDPRTFENLSTFTVQSCENRMLCRYLVEDNNEKISVKPVNNVNQTCNVNCFLLYDSVITGI